MAATVQEWLDARAAGVPPELMQRIRAAVGSVDVQAGTEQPDEDTVDRQVHAFMQVVIDQVSHMRGRPGTDRGDALDLLTADALLTYALEFVADVKPEAMSRYAVELMCLVGGV